MNFSYDEMVTRNLGFIDENEQQKLKEATVFVPGVGGMGGALVSCLARAGVGNIFFADMDEFEVSNLNRQIFADADSIGKSKALATEEALLKINPTINLRVGDETWVDDLDATLKGVDVVVNGCDDTRATLKLARACKDKNLSIIDAFAATLPSVYVAHPNDKRPEEVFGYPSVGKDIDALSDEEVQLCAQREIEWVMAFSSSRHHVVMPIALEMVAGERSRFSFAPMVWMTGCMMAYEAVRIILGKPGGPGVEGVFYNPWSGKSEKPPMWPMRAIKLKLTRAALAQMMK